MEEKFGRKATSYNHVQSIMILYHFTAREYLTSVACHGLWKGEVAITAKEVLNAVWLTTDPSANGHGLCNRRELTPEEKQLFSVRLDQKAFFPDKRAIRFRVVIPSSDRKLVHWPKWGKKRLERWWYDALNKTGSGKANTWWLYWGNIPAEALEAADLASGQLLEGWPAMFRDAKGFQRPPLFDATAALAELERRL